MFFGWMRQAGQGGRAPVYCSSRCYRHAGYVRARAAHPYLSPEERSESSRAGGYARWRGLPPDARSAAARHSFAGRWAGHTLRQRDAHTLRQRDAQPRQPRACRYCGDVVPMTRPQVKCGKDDCRLSYNAERMRRRWDGPAPTEDQPGNEP